MKTYRGNAIAVGVLYITGTVTGVLSVVFSGSLLDGPDMLTNIAANANQLILAAIMILAMGVSLAVVPVAMYPVSKRTNPVLALGYVVFRGALETVGYMMTVVCMLLLVGLSRFAVGAPASDASSYQVLGSLLAGSGGWITQMGTVVFIIGALMFYWVLYRNKLVPRWISGWGLITAFPYLAAAFLVMFGVVEHFSTVDGLLRGPLGIQEMVLAVWLIVKGFNPLAATIDR